MQRPATRRRDRRGGRRPRNTPPRGVTLNNLLKNVGIWLVIGLVVLTVVKQFDIAADDQGLRPLFRVHGQGQGGTRRIGDRRGPHDQVGRRGQEALPDLQPRRHLDGRRPRQVRRQGRGQAGGGADRSSPQIFISWFPMLLLIGVWIFFMRQMQGGGRGGAFSFGKSKAQDARRVEQHRHLRRRRRLRRGQGGSERAGRVPARPVQVPEAGRTHPARRADGRLAGHRQDAAREGHRRRGQGAVLLDLRLRLRRDVRRRRRGARARHVRAGEEERAVHRVHRRNRRRRPPARRRPGRRQRRARADAEPAAGRDGRLRGQRRASSSSPRPTAPTCSTRR